MVDNVNSNFLEFFEEKINSKFFIYLFLSINLEIYFNSALKLNFFVYNFTARIKVFNNYLPGQYGIYM